MPRIGTPLSPQATRVLLLGSGELGKEVAIELQRFGVEVIAADRYADAPAMQVAHRTHTSGSAGGWNFFSSAFVMMRAPSQQPRNP